MKKLRIYPVDSGNITRVAFHRDSDTLYVEFKSRVVYSYDAGLVVFAELLTADSVGGYFSSRIRALSFMKHDMTLDSIAAKLNEGAAN